MTKRLFVATPLPKEYREKLLKSVRLYDFNKARLTKEENLHLTILFLGNVEESQIPEIVDKLEKLAQKTKPFELCFDKIQPAPPGRQKTMTWAIFKKSLAFENLTRDAFGSLKNLTSETLPNPLPHVTLARFDRKPSFLESEELSLPPFLVTKVQLIESKLYREGARYEAIKEVSLASQATDKPVTPPPSRCDGI